MKKSAVSSILVAAVLLAVTVIAEAQQSTKVPQIGFLSLGSVASMASRVNAFQNGLREHGYVEDRNIHVEYRYADGDQNRLRQFAAELVSLKVDAVVTGGSLATRPAMQATSTIPVIMA